MAINKLLITTLILTLCLTSCTTTSYQTTKVTKELERTPSNFSKSIYLKTETPGLSKNSPLTYINKVYIAYEDKFFTLKVFVADTTGGVILYFVSTSKRESGQVIEAKIQQSELIQPVIPTVIHNVSWNDKEKAVLINLDGNFTIKYTLGSSSLLLTKAAL